MQFPFEEVYTPKALDETVPRFVGSAVTPRRVRIMAGIGIGVLLLLLARAVELSVFQAKHWRAVASSNRIRTIELPAARGEIWDRRGQLLVSNSPSFAVIVFPQRLPAAAEAREKILRPLLAQLGANPADIAARLENTTVGDFVTVAEHLSPETALPLMTQGKSDAVAVVFRPDRSYTASADSIGGGVLGYTGRVGPGEYKELMARGYQYDDLLGRVGLERAFEGVLRGTRGQLRYEVGADLRLQGTPEEIRSRAGNTLKLTLDSELARVIDRAFLSNAARKRGAAVVLDARSGALLALKTFPDFRPGIFSSGDRGAITRLLEDARKPLLLRPTAGQYPPGSTIKPFIAAALLSENRMSAASTVQSRGGIRIAGSFFPDWKDGGHGRTDVRKALAESVNTFFYLMVGGYPFSDGQYPLQAAFSIETLQTALARFGFTQQVGVQHFDEAVGFFPTPAWKERVKHAAWYIGDTYHLAIGQGDVLVTPLQLAVATAAVANGGRRFQPSVLEEIADPSGDSVMKVTPKLVEDLTDQREALAIVREGMRRAVESGSARGLQGLPIAVAGKTGTAQWSRGRNPHSWFIGFAPYENPQIALSVLVEEGGEGSGPALLIAKEIFKWYAQQPAR